MKTYKCILLAVDLHPKNDKLTVNKAAELAKEYHAKLYLVHALEHINAYGVAQAYPTVLDLEDEMLADARKELTKLGEKWGIPQADQFIEIGSPKSVILHKADELKADLIVVGSHGRHGVSLLLGSTANSVLHYAPCDVLAVRIAD